MNTQRIAPILLSLLRLILGFLIVFHGTQKFFGFPGDGAGPGPAHQTLTLLQMLAGTLELIGGLLFLLGAFTRPIAFLLSGEMAFAYFMAHAPRGFYPILNRGELAIIFCFLFLYFAAAGAGPLSVDALIGGRGRTK